MTFPQFAILALLMGLLAVFAADRFRIELVALAGLGAGLLLGLVPVSQAFSGFAHPAVLTVAEVLILARLLARTHVMDLVTFRLARFAHSDRSVLAFVCSFGALTSMFMNNIGALALWVPVTLSLCRSSGVAPGKVLIPLSFATLLGGTCSLIGTPANLVVSNFQVEATGEPLGFFDLAWVGIPITCVGVLWLILAAPRLLTGRGIPLLSSASRAIHLSLVGRSPRSKPNSGARSTLICGTTVTSLAAGVIRTSVQGMFSSSRRMPMQSPRPTASGKRSSRFPRRRRVLTPGSKPSCFLKA